VRQGILAKGSATLFFDYLDGIHELDLVCLIRVSSLSQSIKGSVETDQFNYWKQVDTVDNAAQHSKWDAIMSSPYMIS
jgi:hypothetical protein